MVEKVRENSRIIWQNPPEDGGIAEPAILVEPYSDVISITQEDQVINLNYESVDEFCRLLRQLKNERK